eukprot:TRINITY_DN6372_c0_g1_i1.p1 TRINITY_DN6372_c0_g1~~TRINITY_DN6372_c0_g1_i1.p1  ORF type:complete len:148 (+),score=9.28 TRINITY_DN6372_c0_g1_i1:96-539(+)
MQQQLVLSVVSNPTLGETSISQVLGSQSVNNNPDASQASHSLKSTKFSGQKRKRTDEEQAKLREQRQQRKKEKKQNPHTGKCLLCDSIVDLRNAYFHTEQCLIEYKKKNNIFFPTTTGSATQNTNMVEVKKEWPLNVENYPTWRKIF